VTASTDVARQRRRVRAAHAALTRVQAQRDEFATAYGQATTAQERFNAAAFALRGAAASGRHQPDQAEVARRLDVITDQMTQLLDELFVAQQAKADKTIRADQRRIARNERRREVDSRTGNTHPRPERLGGRTPAA